MASSLKPEADDRAAFRPLRLWNHASSLCSCLQQLLIGHCFFNGNNFGLLKWPSHAHNSTCWEPARKMVFVSVLSCVSIPCGGHGENTPTRRPNVNGYRNRSSLMEIKTLLEPQQHLHTRDPLVLLTLLFHWGFTESVYVAFYNVKLILFHCWNIPIKVTTRQRCEINTTRCRSLNQCLPANYPDTLRWRWRHTVICKTRKVDDIICFCDSNR